MKSSITLLAILFFSAVLAYGQQKKDTVRNIQTFEVSEALSYQYQKPKFFDMLKYIPMDIAEFGKFTFQKENLIWTGSAIGATAAIVTITVIAINYPEIKWIKPVGYTLMGIMAFEMMSSKVHWASDYPLALLLGYVVGKNAANRRIRKKNKNEAWGQKYRQQINTDFNYGKLGQYKTFGVKLRF